MAVVTGLFLLGVLFPPLPTPVFSAVGSVISSYVTETKASQECLFVEQRRLHLLLWMQVQNGSKCGQKEGLLQCKVPKEQDACLCLYTCSVYLSHGNLLIVAASKCM